MEELVRRRLRRLRAGRRGRPRALAVGAFPPTAGCSTRESATTSAGPAGKALLVLGFESAHHPVDAPMRWRLRSPGARRRAGRGPTQRARPTSPEGARKRPPVRGRLGPGRRLAPRFPPAPYLRDSLVACGVLSDTFETAITWDRFPDFHAR